MSNEKLTEAMENVKLFLKGAFGMEYRATASIRKEAMDAMDNYMLLCFADLLGLPNPVSYYTLEMLPYLADDLATWERRIVNRHSVVNDRWGDFCC
jgi:hypothetical protein